MAIYISGPMTGYPEYNYPAFYAAADALEGADYDVVNPAELGHVPEWTLNDYLRRDVAVMLSGMLPDGDVHPAVEKGGPVDTIALLPGWEHSVGANFEVVVARKLDWRIDTLAAWLQMAASLSTEPRGPGTPTHAATLARPTHG